MRFLARAAAVAVLALGSAALGSCGGSGGDGGGDGGGGGDGLSVLIIRSDSEDAFADVAGRLSMTGWFTVIGGTDASSSGSTPPLSTLQAFDVVLVWSNTGFDDPTAIGDLLADYVDGGGALVLAVFALDTFWGFGGRFQTDDYFAIPETAGLANDGPVTLGAFNSSHPILAGVSSFSGGTGSYRPDTLSVHAQATEVASWSDGTPLVATRTIGGVRRVDLGFFPPSNAVDPASWDATTDGDLLLANALRWVAGDV
jgi:hypothetical protein